MANAKSLVLAFILFLTVAVVFSSFSKSYVVFAATKGPVECKTMPDSRFQECCQTTTEDDGIEITWCTICDNPTVGPATNCGPRYPQTDEVAPPPPTTTTCPDPNQALGATGNCAPLTQAPEAPSPKSVPGNLLPEGIFGGPGASPEQGEMTPEVAPPTGPEGDDQTQSRINTSPTGGCIPSIKTQCVPCDPGLPGGDCILEDDWETTIGTTAARGAVACGPPPMPACGPHSPPPPPPPTNHVVKGPQGGEAEQPPATEEAQPATAEEEQPVPICQEGLEFNEDLGFCVPTECPEGQELNEQAGICVLEEPEVADVPEQSEPEQPEQQSSEEGDGSQDNGNNDDN